MVLLWQLVQCWALSLEGHWRRNGFLSKRVFPSPGSCRAVSPALDSYSMTSPGPSSSSAFCSSRLLWCKDGFSRATASLATLPGDFAAECHLSASMQWMTFCNTPGGKQRAASVTPLCEQPPLQPLDGSAVSSETHHLPVDGFPWCPWEQISASSICSSSANLPGGKTAISPLAQGLGLCPSLGGPIPWSVSGLGVVASL